jgi:MFS family permease
MQPSPTAEPRVHYAWWIVTASLVIEFFGLGFGIFALTASYPYLIQTFGWSRTATLASMTFVVSTVALCGPLVGAFLDRHSIRPLFVAGSLIQAMALVLLSRVQTLPQYYAASVLLGVGMSGVTVLPNQVLVSRWFRARLGLVNGIITAGTMLGGSASPVLLTRLAEQYGWRPAFLVMAVLVGTLPPLVSVLLVRDRPSDLGLAPYGGDGVEPVAQTAGALGEAARQPTLWLLAVALFCGSWPCYAATKHIILYLRELGVEPLMAAGTLSWMLFASTVGRLVFGSLWDYVPARAILVADYVLLAAGSLLLLAAHLPAVRAVYVLVFGLAYGGLMPLVPLTVVAYFGRERMGAILGCFKLFYDGASATAPLLTAYLYDRLGSYTLAFELNAMLPCVALVVVAVLVRPPSRVDVPVGAPIAAVGGS